MSAPTPQMQRTPTAGGVHRLSRRGILLLGVVGIPLALLVALNSYGPLTEDGALRMAFATVAGHTVAILSAVAALAITLVRRRGASPTASRAEVVLFVVIAALVMLHAIAGMTNAGDILLSRLELIAETDLLNR